MQFKVPQNIDMEDKIVGPLTLTQFMELVFCCLVSYAIWRYGGTILAIAVGGPILLFGLALAFLKIQDQPFSRFALSLAQYVIRPKYRVWKKDPMLEKIAVPTAITPIHHDEEEAALNAQMQRRSETRSQLESLSQLLDTQGNGAVEAKGGVTASGIEKTVADSRPKKIIVNASK